MSADGERMSTYSCPGGTIPDRNDWRTVVSCWRGFLILGDHMEDAFEAYLAMAGPAYARMYAQVRAHPNGRRLFRDRPDLLSVLRDDSYLASLAPGTLGHAYRSFLASNRFDAGVHDEATVIRPIAERNGWDEDFYYLMVRATALHDVFHVLGNYGPDMAGEITVVGFHCGQLAPVGAMERIGYLSAITVPGAPLRHRLKVFRQAVERGRRADRLFATPWEELFDRPLDEVRAQVGVAPTHIAHPDGGWFTRWTPPGMAPATPWDYDKILAECRG